jgi:hypothetical protein
LLKHNSRQLLPEQVDELVERALRTEQIAKALTLRDQGVSFAKIGEQLGTSSMTVGEASIRPDRRYAR